MYKNISSLKRIIILLFLSLLLSSCLKNDKVDIQEKADNYNKNEIKKEANKLNVENKLNIEKKSITKEKDNALDEKKEVFELCEKSIKNGIGCTLNENYQIEKVGKGEIIKSKDFVLFKHTELTKRGAKEGKTMLIPNFIGKLQTRSFFEFEKSNFVNLPVGTIVILKKSKLEIIKKINEEEFFKYLKETFEKHGSLDNKKITALFSQLKKEIKNSYGASEKDVKESKIFMIGNLFISKVGKGKKFSYGENICIEISNKKECWELLKDSKNQKTSHSMIGRIVVNSGLKTGTKFRFFSNGGHKGGISEEIIILDK